MCVSQICVSLRFKILIVRIVLKLYVNCTCYLTRSPKFHRLRFDSYVSCLVEYGCEASGGTSNRLLDPFVLYVTSTRRLFFGLVDPHIGSIQRTAQACAPPLRGVQTVPLCEYG